MSKTVSRSRRKKRASNRRSEALGIIVLLLGFVLLLSLISYSQTDPPAINTAADNPGNWMGRLGALLAYGMVGKLGRIPPLLTILVILLWGWRLLRSSVNRALIATSLKILGIQILLSILLAFPHFLLGGTISYDLAGEWGGLIAGFLVTNVGIGAPLVWLALLLLFLMAAFGLKPGEIAGAVAAMGRKTGSAVASISGTVGKIFTAIVSGIRSVGSSVSSRRNAKKVKGAASGIAAGDAAGDSAGDEAGDGETAIADTAESPLSDVERFTKSTDPVSTQATDAIEDVPEDPVLIEVKPVRSKPVGKKQKAGASSGPSAGGGTFNLPSLEIFSLPAPDERGPDEDEVRKEAALLQEKLLSFGVKAEVNGWQTGPIVTRFEIEPASGVKVNQIVNLADDLALAMRAKRIRIVAPIPGKAAVGVEIPNHTPRIVRLREVLESEAWADPKLRIPMALGMDIGGMPFVADLAGMPHLLLAGTTGSGKSVSINAIIASILLRMGPEECRFIMVDPKMLELAIYNTIPHLITPVVTNPKKALDALRWAVLEMERRYDKLAAVMVRDILQYNAKLAKMREELDQRSVEEVEADDLADDLADDSGEIAEHLPYIIVVVDELADLMLTASADIETLIQRLAQKARAVGIHLILATQRPSVDVITGPIKANFSSRIAFQVPSKTDSRTILDANGAEKLLGQGDMLFMNPVLPEALRVHGCFISNDEIEALANLVSGQEFEGEGVDIFAPAGGDPGGMGAAGDSMDEFLRDAAWIVVTNKQGSISLIQRRLGVGYTRAARIMDQLEMLGVVGPPDGTKARHVTMDEEHLEDVSWDGR
ncbi:DNA translocase FtsK 4TM domain-containing protein [Gemmatimonadota bacterium]